MLWAGFSGLHRCQKLGFSAWVLSPFSKDVSTGRFIFTDWVWVVPGEGGIQACAASVESTLINSFSASSDPAYQCERRVCGATAMAQQPKPSGLQCQEGSKWCFSWPQAHHLFMYWGQFGAVPNFGAVPMTGAREWCPLTIFRI